MIPRPHVLLYKQLVVFRTRGISPSLSPSLCPFMYLYKDKQIIVTRRVFDICPFHP